MRNLKHIGLLLILIISFIRCTEIYSPDINSEKKVLVVEGLITNESGPFSVKLTEAMSYSNTPILYSKQVLAAKIRVIDSKNRIYKLIDNGSGVYTLPATFKSEIGNSYKLSIETKDGYFYESSTEKLLPPMTIDSIRGIFATSNYIDISNNTKTVNGADLRVDLFKSVTSSEPAPYCRFKSDITLQYSFTYNLPDTTDWHYFCFGWEKYLLNSNENITELKSATANPTIFNHSMGFIPSGSISYGLNTPVDAKLMYYLRISQYTINKDVYDFYSEAKNQLAANGKIFDPVTSQLIGNMKCINNPSKIVLGLFEVSSVSNSAYLVDIVSVAQKVYLNKAQLNNIPNSGSYRYRVWDADQSRQPKTDEYVEIPFPVWWSHNQK
jgi:hypothetical protein